MEKERDDRSTVLKKRISDEIPGVRIEGYTSKSEEFIPSMGQDISSFDDFCYFNLIINSRAYEGVKFLVFFHDSTGFIIWNNRLSSKITLKTVHCTMVTLKWVVWRLVNRKKVCFEPQGAQVYQPS